MPVADLIGLRFSLLHLRLVGYGVLAVWGIELVNLVTSEGLLEIAPRLHYISLLLDRTPLLLVGIGLVAYQGGLRRHPLESRLLPLLFALLPLLSAFHFFLAPISLVNAYTLVHKQASIGQDQVQRIERLIGNADSALSRGDSVETMLRNLQGVPGLKVNVPPDAPLLEARREVRSALVQERERLRRQIAVNQIESRRGFLRRAQIDAAIGLTMGVALWALHSSALREMEQSIPYLAWALASAPLSESPAVLVELQAFQRACVALAPLSLLGGFAALLRGGRPEEPQEPPLQPVLSPAELSELIGGGVARPSAPRPLPVPGRGVRATPAAYGHAAGLDPSGFPEEEEAPAAAPSRPWNPALSFLRGPQDAATISRRERRRSLRDLERYRRLARRLEEDPAYGTYLASQGLPPSGADPSSPPAPRQAPRGIGRLWRWFLSHL